MPEVVSMSYLSLRCHKITRQPFEAMKFYNLNQAFYHVTVHQILWSKSPWEASKIIKIFLFYCYLLFLRGVFLRFITSSLRYSLRTVYPIRAQPKHVRQYLKNVTKFKYHSKLNLPFCLKLCIFTPWSRSYQFLSSNIGNNRTTGGQYFLNCSFNPEQSSPHFK